MRFMMMHKNDPHTEAGKRPPMELVNEMGAFIGEHMKAGRFVDGAGLGASSTRTRLTFRNGQCTTKRGPYAGERELPAATLLLKVRTRDVAIGWAERYGKILGDGEIEIGKVTEPWDLGLMPPPENPPLQILLIEKADQATEGAGRSPQQKAALSRLKTEMTEAGVLVRSLALQPSAKGKRLNFTSNNLRVTDGPFVESKELIGGFAVLDLSNMEEAIALCRRYAEILGAGAGESRRRARAISAGTNRRASPASCGGGRGSLGADGRAGPAADFASRRPRRFGRGRRRRRHLAVGGPGAGR